MRRSNTGFTLVEMLVVISIIAILAGMLMPAIMAARVKAQETHTLNLIHNCESAATAFFNDRGDYPPSTWAELDEFFDVEGHGTGGSLSDESNHSPSEGNLDVWVDEYPMEVDRNKELVDGGYDGDYDDDGNRDTEPDTDEAPRVCRVNEGIEVFLACLAGRDGGPYMEVEASWVANTDADFDRSSNENDQVGETDTDPDILQATNWYFGGTINEPQAARELVDYWGNPLVYFHNRDYDRCDRHSDNYAFTTYPDDHWPRYARSGYVSWGQADGDEPQEVTSLDADQLEYPISVSQSELGAPPNLSSFQLYSWGVDREPGDHLGGQPPASENQKELLRQWRDNLANWELEE